jgi:hypothetical protein
MAAKVLLGVEVLDALPYNDYFEYFDQVSGLVVVVLVV